VDSVQIKYSIETILTDCKCHSCLDIFFPFPISLNSKCEKNGGKHMPVPETGLDQVKKDVEKRGTNLGRFWFVNYHWTGMIEGDQQEAPEDWDKF